jgi:hypothetical protein
MHRSDITHISGDPQLVSTLCCLFGSFRSELTQAQPGSNFTLRQDRS